MTEIIGEWEGLPVERVLEILCRSGVTVSVSGEITTLAKGEAQRAYRLPPRIKRRMLRTFSRLFGVEFHVFFV